MEPSVSCTIGKEVLYCLSIIPTTLSLPWLQLQSPPLAPLDNGSRDFDLDILGEPWFCFPAIPSLNKNSSLLPSCKHPVNMVIFPPVLLDQCKGSRIFSVSKRSLTEVVAGFLSGKGLWVCIYESPVGSDVLALGQPYENCWPRGKRLEFKIKQTKAWKPLYYWETRDSGAQFCVLWKVLVRTKWFRTEHSTSGTAVPAHWSMCGRRLASRGLRLLCGWVDSLVPGDWLLMVLRMLCGWMVLCQAIGCSWFSDCYVVGWTVLQKEALCGFSCIRHVFKYWPPVF